MKKLKISLVSAVTAAILLTSCANSPAGSDNTSSSSVSETSITTVATTTTTTTEATTTTTEFTPVPVKHTFNPHVLSDIYLMAYGEDFKENFFRYCDAVLEGADSVALDKKDYYYQCRDAVRYCLPVADEYVYYMDTKEASNGDGTYKLQYSVPKDEYLSKVSEFKTRIEDLINRACYEGDTPLETAIALYASESERLDYDYSSDVVNENGVSRSCNPYHALMTDNGICQEIAGCYSYLLLQAGIDAATCGALNDDASESHEWSVVKLNGKYYHCDVTFQCSSDKQSLRYFGMSDQRRHLEGNWSIDGFNFAGVNLIWHKDLPLEDETFDPLSTCMFFNIDREKDMLYCYGIGGESKDPYFEMSLK